MLEVKKVILLGGIIPTNAKSKDLRVTTKLMTISMMPFQIIYVPLYMIVLE